MTKDTKVKLASGHQMPLVGFGLWKVNKDTCADTVYEAIKSGYRLFDGAYDYQNEAEAGAGIKRAISEGIVKREEIFIVTKLWNNYHAKEHAIEMGRKQNETWGLGYIDLFLIHFPCALEYINPEIRRYPAWWMGEDRTIKLAKVPIHETWQSMEALVDEGVARSIGISNAQAQLLYDIQTYARYPISSLQIEHHPYLVQAELIAMAQENNIMVTAYSSFGPQSFLELPPAFRKRAADATPLFEHQIIKSISSRCGRSPAQVLLRWATQRGIAVIPKSNNKTRLKENFEVADGWELQKEEVEAISALDRGLRFNDPGFYLPNFPLRIFA